MPGGREPSHVDPDLGDDHVSGGDTDAGDGIQPVDRVSERGDLLFDLRFDVGDVCIDGVDPSALLS